jgi:virginiamycin B lyase
VNGTAITMPHRIWHWRIWLVPAVIVFAAGLGILVWRFGPWSDPGFIEHRMLVETDIPTALAVAPNGAVWFTIEFSDAIAVFRNGKIERFPKGTQNLEPLGLAVDAAGGAWYTDTPLRVISRISPDGNISSFPLSTPIVRLGRVAVAPDGAVWFADVTTASVTRFQDGVFMRHDIGSLGATPYGIAVDNGGTVWTTLQGADKLARISSNGRVIALDVPTHSSGLGDIAVDQSGAVWFLELRANKIGRFTEERFTEFMIPTPSAGLTALAAAPDGSVWFTELSVGKLGRLRDGKVAEFRLPRADARPFAVAVDTANNVWYTDLSGWLGMLPADRAKAR